MTAVLGDSIPLQIDVRRVAEWGKRGQQPAGRTVTHESRCLGLVGGLGPGATVHYYNDLVAAHAARGRVLRLLMAHADVGRVLRDVGDGNLASLVQYLSEIMCDLADGGAQVAAIAAVTPHVCAPDLVKSSPLPLIDLVETVAQEIHAQGLTRVALFGTRFTVETGLFGRLAGVDIVQPRPDELDYVHRAYLEIVQARRGSEANVVGLRTIAHTLCQRDGAQAIVLAGTELALAFNPANTDFPVIDGARVHLDAILRRICPTS